MTPGRYREGMNLPEPQQPRPVDPRVGFAERDAVVEVLQQAAAEGRLTIEELDERVEAALRARTRSDLTPLIDDLPAGQRMFEVAVPQRGPGWSPDDPLTLSAGWDREKREGRWTIPPWIVVNSGLGDVRLDCRVATPAEPVITIQVMSGMGNVTIIVPEGWGANVDRLDSGWGTKKIKVSAVPEPGRPLLRFEGNTGLSTLTVRHESRWDKKIQA